MTQIRLRPLEDIFRIIDTSNLPRAQIRGVTRLKKLAGHNKGLLIMDPYIYIG